MPRNESNRSSERLVDPLIDTIHCRDCIVGMKEMRASSVDLVFADPPFNIGYGYDEYDDNKSAFDYLEWSDQWMAEAVRILKPTGTLWLAIGDEFAAELKVKFQEDHKLICRSWVIWYYTFGQNCKTNFSRSHTHLLYFIKDPEHFTFNISDIRVPSARQLVYGDSRGKDDGRLPDNTWILRPQAIPESFQPEDDTWYIPRVNGTFKERRGWHGCQMPEQLLGRIIRACSNVGDYVLDPFIGSGTTPAVAKKLGRHFVGFELSTKYAKHANERVNAASEGQPLEGADNPLLSSPATGNTRRSTKRHNDSGDQPSLF